MRRAWILVVVSVTGCPKPSVAPTREPVADGPVVARVPETPAEPALPENARPFEVASVDRLLAVRYQSQDPELALFAARVGTLQARFEACAEPELRAWTGPPGFVRVTIDQTVARKATGEIAIAPTAVAGIGSATMHQCVHDAIATLTLPAMLGHARRERIALSVDLRIGPRDPALVAEPEHDDDLVLDDTGGCAWLHENPCAPHKSCMAATRRPTQCPIGWGPQPRSNAGNIARRVVFYQRACADAADVTCTLTFNRDADACEAKLRAGEDVGIAIAMTCVDFERLWSLSTSKALPKVGKGYAASAFAIGANRIEPGWSAYRARSWHWEAEVPPPLALLEWSLLEHGAALGLPVAARLAFDATKVPQSLR